MNTALKQKVLAVGCLALLVVLMITTDPARLPSFMLIVPFVLLFIVLFVGISSAFRRTIKSTSRIRLVSGMTAVIPVALLVLQSIGQLTIRDVLTVAALFAISHFYVARTFADSSS